MNRIVTVAINEIIIDPRQASDLVTKACHRKPHMKAVGLCETADSLVISLEECPENESFDYVFAPFPYNTLDEIIAEISSRYHAGFSLIGDFSLARPDQKWGLFALSKSAAPGHPAAS